MNRRPLMERFWEKVDKRSHEDCWEWTASKRGYGYGQIANKGKVLHAHRLSWELKNGPIPKGMCVLHSCDNPGCVNPSHLFLGTQGDNMRDAAKKCRTGMLSEGAVRDIRSHRIIRFALKKELAQKYNVPISIISRAARGVSYRGIDSGVVESTPRKMSEQDIAIVRSSDESGRCLAERFGVHRSTISLIKKGLSPRASKDKQLSTKYGDG